MSATIQKFAPAVEKMKAELAEIEEKVVTGYTLADAMRDGCRVTTPITDWGYSTHACALSAAAIAARARGLA